MNTSCLFTVSAPSGAGKTSLVKELLNQHPVQLALSTSHATRAKRPGEQDGVDYHFISVNDFEEKVARGEFLEHAKVFDNYYGTSQQSIENLLAQDKNVILEIDWQGAQQVKTKISDTVSIFILPPSRDALRQRLTQRGQDDESIIEKRMAQADSEMSHYAQADYLVINDDFDTALQELSHIVLSQSLMMSRQKVRHSNLLSKIIA